MVQLLGREVSLVAAAAVTTATTTAAACYLALRSRRKSRDEPPGPAFFIPFVVGTSLSASASTVPLKHKFHRVGSTDT